MLLSYEFIKAENEYRREKFRDQSKRATGPFEKATAAILVAALFLTACGVAVESEPGAVNQVGVVDQAPAWQPNYELLERVISGATTRPAARVPAIEFGGMPAPSWQPDLDALESVIQQERDLVKNVEPTWHPNYGRLESRIGASQATGPR